MGSSKKVTVSYWYKLIAHLGWCKGPIDALLAIRGGDREAWKGRQTTSGIINVNKPNLYGGESAEGGIDGQFEVMMGEADQMPNSYLASEFGEAQPGYRGRSTIVLRGPKIGAGNPYPKPLYFKLQRIFKGWDNDVCWYPEKAAISFDSIEVPYDGVWKYRVEAPGSSADYRSPSYDDSDWAQGPGGFGSLVPPGSTLAIGTFVSGQMGKGIWIRRTVNFVGLTRIDVYHDDGRWLYVDGEEVALTQSPNYFYSYADVVLSGNSVIALKVLDGIPGGSPNIFAGMAFSGVTDERLAMNPAHILYDSITSRRENGGMEEPIARINDASFRAAADKFYSEGFGLCCTWYGGESAEQFQQRICNVAGASLSQSRKDGQYYIDLLREPLAPASLPTITDDDIREWEAEPAVPPESINQTQVKWFDPETRQERITTPVQSLGAIEDAGGVIADVREYYEIPFEPLALRVAQRDLQSVASALWKFTISCTRRPYDLRPGMQVRLLCPERGFADVVVVVGDIDYGDFSNDEISLIAVQDVFSTPSGSFVDPQDGLGPPTSQDPVNIDNAIAMETPYVELAATLTTAELEALHEDVGYLMVGARRPANGNNYLLATKAAGEEYETYGNNDWTPSARIVEGDSLPNVTPQISFTIIQRQLLDRVVVGTWAWWGNELCRVDALDLDDGTITLGRACGDTVPQEHPPLEMIYFIGDWYGTDSREYADGEEVSAKLMNRTGQGQVDIAAAPEVSVEMGSRQARPYPPAKVRVNGDPFPTAATGEITLTWAHRDRLLQADQLIDGEQDSIGPEPGTTYNVRWFIGDMLLHSETGVTGTTAGYFPAVGGMMRVELESERDGLVSWQMQVREFPVGSPLLAEDNTVITAENGDAIIMG